MFNIVNDFLEVVCLSDQCPRSFIFEVCEVYMQMVVGGLVVHIDSNLVCR